MTGKSKKIYTKILSFLSYQIKIIDRIKKQLIENKTSLCLNSINQLQEHTKYFSIELKENEQKINILHHLESNSYRTNIVISKLVSLLSNGLLEINIPAEISVRVKTPYSIMQKAQRKKVDFKKLSDVVAIRIIVSTENECYNILKLISNLDGLILGKFKDYIKNPKKNDYQSIHAIVFIKTIKQRAEIQIRTKEMHYVAEKGKAAHYKYKEEQKQEYQKLLELYAND
ncbi:MAG: hypothetical protein LN588_03725 [Rickettsia endosymbiont of Bryobia graminum]|nr:hypothetical protein [Rickettsia endosymbiont of Bryobia graminum]